ncbi:hypothetical protein [Caldisericum sp.]|jgi:hypothetical protein|uniref:hypothetical protein n=1 Tax=Caldisericum sp. TaxID=2499687 RepID=UPI003D0EDCAC
MKKKLIIIILVTIFCLSSILPRFGVMHAVDVSSINPPPEWVFSDQNQKVLVTLNGVTYYAYELKKISSNTPGGWLITDSNGEIVYDNDTYQKLALAATVYKITNDQSTINSMQSEINLLKSIRWRIDLYESVTAITKIIVNISTALTGKLIGYGGLEELLATTLAPIKSREGNRIQDELFSLFSKDFVADATSQVSKCLSILGKVSTSKISAWLKVFSVLNIVLRKEAASFARGGCDAYQEAYNILKKDRNSWSYEEALSFLNKYKEGRTRGLPFAKWYLTLIPHSSNQLENIGDVLWDNIGKELLDSLGDKEVTFMADIIDAEKLSSEFITKSLADKLISSDLSNDIKNASSIFAIYRLYYDVSIKGSLADQIVSALQAQKAKEEATVKDKTIYKIGDRIQATDYINVREDPSLNGKIKAVVKKGEIGTIKSNYKIADGYRWWTVKWDSGPQGWCAGAYLEIYTEVNSSGETEQESGKWVLILGESLPVLDGISPAGHAIIGGECKEGENCWKTLSEVHAGDFLDYISTESAAYSSSLFLSFPGCTKAYKVRDKSGNVGWLIGDWGGVTLSKVVDSKITQDFKPISFSKISGKWSGHWVGTFFEEGELSFIFQQENMLIFKGTGIITLSGSDKTRNVIVKGSIVNNSFSFLEVQPDGSYKYCSGTISPDGKTIDGWKYSYDSLAIPLGEFHLTFQGG